MRVELISYTENPIEKIEIAASTCYNSKPTNGKILNHCYKSGHHSVLEFVTFHFKISGISRACSHQLVRHRMASYAQRSQRYCNEDGFEWIIPKKLYSNREADSLYDTTMIQIENCYKKLISLGIPEEDARYILPNACCTEINVAMNFRELIHFMNERLCTCAQWEIRKMAQLMKDEVLKIFPEAKDKLVPKCEKNPNFFYCTEDNKRSCHKHSTISEIKERINLD